MCQTMLSSQICPYTFQSHSVEAEPAFRDSVGQDFMSTADYPVTICSFQTSDTLYHLCTFPCTVSFA